MLINNAGRPVTAAAAFTITGLTPRDAYLVDMLRQVGPRTVWGLAIEGVLEDPTPDRLNHLLDQLASQYRDNAPAMTGILGAELAAFLAFHRRAIVTQPVPISPRYVHLLADVRRLAIDALFTMEPGGAVYKVVERRKNVTHYEEVHDGAGRAPRARVYHNRGPINVYIVNQQTPTI